jgi:hypothetical protein
VTRQTLWRRARAACPGPENTRPRLDRCSAHRVRGQRPHRPRSRPVFGPPLRQLASDPFHPVEGGSANDYEYCVGDPVNCNDLLGTQAEAGIGPVQAEFCLGPRAVACGSAFQISRSVLARANSLRSRGVLISEAEVNAFRHVLWMARVTQLFGGEFAARLGVAHELDTIGKNAGNWIVLFDSLTDLGNNQAGIALGNFARRRGSARLLRGGIEGYIVDSIRSCRTGAPCPYAI